MTTIDYTAYPHIIDLIWSHLDLKTLLVLRPLCSAWRIKFNKLLQRHMLAEVRSTTASCALKLSLKQEEDPCLSSCSQTLGPLPRYSLNYAYVRDEDAYSLPPAAAGDALVELFGNLSVVDILYHGTTLEQALPSLLYLLRADAVVRSKLPKCRNRDFFVWGVGQTQVYFLDPADRMMFHFEEAPAALVLNLDCSETTASPLLEMRSQRLLGIQQIRGSNITFILDHGNNEGRTPRAEYVENLEKYFSDCWQVAAVTLVGLERFFRRERVYDLFKLSFYCTATASFSGLYQDLNANEAAMLERFAAAVKRSDLRRKGAVRLLTCEEYEAEVGHEKYMLYTAYEQQNQIPLMHLPESDECSSEQSSK